MRWAAGGWRCGGRRRKQAAARGAGRLGEETESRTGARLGFGGLQKKNSSGALGEYVAEACIPPAHWSADIDTLVEMVAKAAQPGDTILVMSNGGFGGIHQKLLDRLA